MNPLAEFAAVSSLEMEGNPNMSMFSMVCSQIAEAQLPILSEWIPDHTKRIQAIHTLLAQLAFCFHGALPLNPLAEFAAISGLESFGNPNMSMFSMVCSQIAEAQLPILSKWIPNHTKRIQAIHTLLAQLSFCFYGALPLNPLAEFAAISGLESFGNPNMSMFSMVCSQIAEAQLPILSKWIPNHTKRIQAIHALLAQLSFCFHGALPMNPLAEFAAVSSLEMEGNPNMSMFSMVCSQIAEAQFPILSEWIPNHTKRIQAIHTLLAQHSFCFHVTLPMNPQAEFAAVSSLEMEGNPNMSMFSMVCSQIAEAQLPILSEWIPNHTKRILAIHTLLAQLSFCFYGALPLNPLAEFAAVSSLEMEGNPNMSMFSMVCSQIAEAQLPILSKWIPNHTKRIQAIHTLLAQLSFCFHGALPLNPLAEFATISGLESFGNPHMTMFSMVCSQIAEAPLPILSEWIPHHTKRIQAIHTLLAQLPLCSHVALPMNPHAKFATISGLESFGNPHMTMLSMVCSQIAEAQLPVHGICLENWWKNAET